MRMAICMDGKGYSKKRILLLWGICWHLSWNAGRVNPYLSKSLSLEMAKLFSTTISCCSQVLPEPVWASWNIFFTCLTLYMGPVTVSELFKGAGYSKLSFDSEKTLGLGDQSGTWDRVISNKMEVGIISIPVLDTVLARCWGGGQVCEALETCKGVECTTQSLSGGWEWKQQMCLRFCFQFLKGSSWSKQYDGCYGSCYLGPWDTPS